jgi:hypothetical protein
MAMPMIKSQRGLLFLIWSTSFSLMNKCLDFTMGLMQIKDDFFVIHYCAAKAGSKTNGIFAADKREYGRRAAQRHAAI